MEGPGHPNISVGADVGDPVRDRSAAGVLPIGVTRPDHPWAGRVDRDEARSIRSCKEPSLRERRGVDMRRTGWLEPPALAARRRIERDDEAVPRPEVERAVDLDGTTRLAIPRGGGPDRAAIPNPVRVERPGRVGDIEPAIRSVGTRQRRIRDVDRPLLDAVDP